MNYARQYPRSWLVYFVLSVVISIANAATALVNLGGTKVVGAAIGLVGLLPLYGYVRQHRYNPRWLWMVILAITGVATIAALIICLYLSVVKLSLIALLVAAAITVLCGPYLLALQQYVFRSPHLWQ